MVYSYSISSVISVIDLAGKPGVDMKEILDMLEFCRRTGKNWNEQKDKNKYTPLIITIIEGYDEIFDFLMNLPDGTLDFEAKDSDGNTALAFAARYNRKRMFDALLLKGCDYNHVGRVGIYTIPMPMFAILGDSLEILKTLESKMTKENFHRQTMDGWTNLTLACETGRFEIIEYLMDKNPELVFQNSNGSSPLYRALFPSFNNEITEKKIIIKILDTISRTKSMEEYFKKNKWLWNEINENPEALYLFTTCYEQLISKRRICSYAKSDVQSENNEATLNQTNIVSVFDR